MTPYLVGYGDAVAHVARELDSLTALFSDGPLDTPVPSCPAWTLTELAEHAGSFSALWAHVLCEGTGRPKTALPPFPDAGGVVAWFGHAGSMLVDELRATPSDTTVWTWVPHDKSAAFVARRALHELSVHRVDAELARGRPGPIDATVAADGIEEIFVMIEAWGDDRGKGRGERLGLRGVDSGHEWVLAMNEDGLAVERGAIGANLTLEGATSDLELALYGRPGLGEVIHRGDASTLDAWRRAFQFG